MRVLPFLAALFAALPALAQGYEDRPGFWHHAWDWGWDGGHMLFGSLIMVAFWGGVVFLILLAVRWFAGGSHDRRLSRATGNALDILAERFARGEIDVKEYEERKRLLSA
jgi:putative membrane protein